MDSSGRTSGAIISKFRVQFIVISWFLLSKKWWNKIVCWDHLQNSCYRWTYFCQRIKNSWKNRSNL